MTPGTLFVAANRRIWLVLSASGAMAAVASLVPPPVRLAGDVVIAPGWVVRTASAEVCVPRGVPVGRLGADLLAECVREAERVTLTARVVSKYAPLRERALALAT